MKHSKTFILNNKKGFTLVEVIVVLVILAILAAVLVPTMTGYIDKAKEKSMVSEGRACVMAAQTVLSESYADPAFNGDIDEAKVAALAEVAGTVTEITFDGSDYKVKHLTYVRDTFTVQYCSQGGCSDCGKADTYTVTVGAAGGAVGRTVQQNLDSSLQALGTKFNALLQSGYSCMTR